MVERFKKDEIEKVKNRSTSIRLSNENKDDINFGIIMEEVTNRSEFIGLLISRWSKRNNPRKKLEDIIEKEEKIMKELEEIKTKKKEVTLFVKGEELKIKDNQVKIIRAIKILKNKMKNGSREEINTIADYWSKETGISKDKIINMAKE